MSYFDSYIGQLGAVFNNYFGKLKAVFNFSLLKTCIKLKKSFTRLGRILPLQAFRIPLFTLSVACELVKKQLANGPIVAGFVSGA